MFLTIHCQNRAALYRRKDKQFRHFVPAALLRDTRGMNFSKRRIYCVFASLASTAMTGCTTTPMIDELASMMQGRFETRAVAQPTGDLTDQRMIDSRQRIKLPELGEHVFYLQLNTGEELSLYRQRILTLQAGPQPQTIEQRAYTIANPQRFEDALPNDNRFATLEITDLKPMFRTGCAQIWKRTRTGFRGYVNPKTCRIMSSRTGKPRRIEAETVLTPTEIRLVERGYSDGMKQLFGTPQGSSTVLYRIAP